jgi:hypothetical protein
LRTSAIGQREAGSVRLGIFEYLRVSSSRELSDPSLRAALLVAIGIVQG